MTSTPSDRQPPRACHHPDCDRHVVIGIGGPGGVVWWCRKHYPLTELEEATHVVAD